MRFRIKVREVGDCGNGWYENYDYDEVIDDETAKAAAIDILSIWNDGLQRHETARELLAVDLTRTRVNNCTG